MGDLEEESSLLLNPNRTATSKTKLVLACYFVLGAGLLGPWNAFLTAVDYFSIVYGPHMDRMFTICYLPMCLLLLILMLNFGPGVADHQVRITTGFVGFIVVTVMVPVVDKVLVGDADRAPESAMAWVLAAVLATGIMDGVAQPAVFVDAAQAGPQYTHAVVGGTACSGLLVSLLRVFTKAGFADDMAGLKASTMVYFVAAGCLSAAGLVVHLLLLPYLGIRHNATSSKDNQESEEGPELGSPGQADEPHMDLPVSVPARTGGVSAPLPSSAAGADPRQVFVLDGDEEAADEPAPGAPLLDLRAASAVVGEEDFDEPVTQDVLLDNTRGRRPAAPHMRGSRRQRRQAVRDKARAESRLRYHWIARVVRQCWPCLLSLFLNYVTTLSIFPGVLGEDSQSLQLGSWYPILLITLFNAFDLVGKVVPIRMELWFHRQYLLLIAATTRALLLMPAMVLASTNKEPVAVMAFLTAILGVSNGYLTALVMTLAPYYACSSHSEELQSSDGAQTVETTGEGDSSGNARHRIPLGRSRGHDYVMTAGTAGVEGSSRTTNGVGTAMMGTPPAGDSAAMMAEELSVLVMVMGLTVGAFLGWAWLLLPVSPS